jgi:hypothetical protein
MTFTTEQLKLIYNAVRYYQINKVSLNSKAYTDCDELLKHLFDRVYEPQNETGTCTSAS